MWTCQTCKRSFERTNQQHSCKTVSIEEHFSNKPVARNLFDTLVEKVSRTVAPVEPLSLPCCLHLIGKSDFLALLPYKDKLEVRFSLPNGLKSERIVASVPINATHTKYCIDIFNTDEIDTELLEWIKLAHSQ
jgi:hypothetical protein